MNRLACVDVPALPLQILLRRHPEWRQEPVAVVTEDKTQARVCWANRRAITLGVRPGMRQVAAVACCPALRTSHVRSSEVEREVRRLAERLHRWSPQVEEASSLGSHFSGFGAAGTFWLQASGLAGLFGPLSEWTEALRKDLAEDGFHTSVAVGFTRFGTFAAARATFGLQILENPAEEKSVALRAPLVRFGLTEKTLTSLLRLGISSLRDLLRLSGKGLGSRFGKEVFELHRLASGERSVPVSGVFQPETPVERRISFEPPETELERLVFHAKRLLDQILADLGKQGLALTELVYEVGCEGDAGSKEGPPVSGVVRPAFPTEDAVKVLSLLRLRLGAVSSKSRTAAGGRRATSAPEEKPGKRILALVLRARGEAYVPEQPGLYQGPGEALSTGPQKASEALAQIQAEFGENSLVRLETRDAHLPRGRYRCQPVSPEKAVLPTASDRGFPKAFFETRTPRLIRRIYDQPLILPHRGSGEPDGWLLRGIEHGPVQSFAGPYRICGGWWRLLSGRPISRDYFFVRLKRGDVCWVFFDRERRSWFLEGRVE